MTPIALGKPALTKSLNSYTFSFEEVDVKVILSRVTDDGKGEAAFYHVNGHGDELLSISDFNLLSPTAANTMAKRLKALYALDNWDTILTYLSAMTLQDVRQGEPIEWVGGKPASMKLEYQLWPILQYKQPTTIYSPGGHFKSYLAAYMACLVHFGWSGFRTSGHTWTPRKGNTLYLDWEDTKEDMDRRVWAIKQGMKDRYTPDPSTYFAYRRCKRPLYDDLPYIQEMVHANKIDLVIIDSQNAASGTGPNESQLATQYYNSVRSLGCTSLTIDHMNKAEIMGAGESAGPIGSVVKFNRSRTQFQIEKSQNAGDDFIEIALINRKNNNTRQIPPIGIHIDWVGSDDVLEEVRFSECDLASNPKLVKVASLTDILKNALSENDKTISELGEKTGKDEKQIGNCLRDHPEAGFYKTGNKIGRQEYWGLKNGISYHKELHT